MYAPFEVLPHGGLDQSILLPVLIGVYVALFFTETLGWVFVGLVVPGYLASVLALQPLTALVIVAEALATYLLARGLAYALAPTGVWAPFFGRDRFFVIVLVSVLVRQHDQLWLLPALSTWLTGQLGWDAPPVREFYSIGLVLVPLTANMLWKPGLRRGLGPLVVVVGLTYAALQLLLLPLTNLSLSSFELLYEDSAIDFLGHARAYVLLLTTATLAARFNLAFGWDFGGILVPALLGLLWFTPREMAVTLLEACVLWALAVLLLRHTPLRRFNLEGPRKLAVVFTLSVALKWTVSLLAASAVPGLRARELFGFGYLLSTLLALRMLPKKAARRVLLPTVATALVGWLVGGALGLGLDLAAPRPAPVSPYSPPVASARLLRTELGALALARVRAELVAPDAPDPDPAALRARGAAWAALARWLADPGDSPAALARDAAAAAGLAIHAMAAPTGPSHRIAHAVTPREHDVVGPAWPSVLVIPGARGPAIAVPRPVAGAPAAEAAAPLCAALDCRLILVAGRDQYPWRLDQAWLDALARLAPEGVVELHGDPDAPEDGPAFHREPDAPDLPPLVPRTLSHDMSSGPSSARDRDRDLSSGPSSARDRDLSSGPSSTRDRAPSSGPSSATRDRSHDMSSGPSSATRDRAHDMSSGPSSALARTNSSLSPGLADRAIPPSAGPDRVSAAEHRPRGRAPAARSARPGDVPPPTAMSPAPCHDLPALSEPSGPAQPSLDAHPGDRNVFGPPRRDSGPPPDLLGPAWGEGRRAVLRARPDALRAALLRGAPAPARAPALLPWLAGQVHAWRERPDAGLLVPSLAELTFLERHVAGPLVHGTADEQALAARLAPLVDAEVWRLDDCGPGAACLALAASGELLVLGAGASPLIVEATRVHDEAGTWRLAAELFTSSGARALLVSIGRAGTGITPFTQAQALHQALAAPAEPPRTLVQIRGLGARPDAPDDLLAIGRLRVRGTPADPQTDPSLAADTSSPTALPLVPPSPTSLGTTALPDTALPPVLQDILSPTGALGWVPRARLVEDAPDLAAFVGLRDPLFAFTAAFTADEALVLWFSPALRRPYAVPDPCLELRRLAALGLLPSELTCVDWLRDERSAALGSTCPEGHVRAPTREPPAALGFAAALEQLEAYAEDGDLHRLRLVLADPDLRLSAGLGRATARGFLALCETAGDRRCALVWLGPAIGGRALAPAAPRALGPALWRRVRTLLVTPEAAP